MARAPVSGPIVTVRLPYSLVARHVSSLQCAATKAMELFGELHFPLAKGEEGIFCIQLLIHTDFMVQETGKNITGIDARERWRRRRGGQCVTHLRAVEPGIVPQQ